MIRRIGQLDTPEKCRQECVKVYRLAMKGEINWKDAHEAAAVLTQLHKMNGGSEKQGEAKWADVGKNAVRG